MELSQALKGIERLTHRMPSEEISCIREHRDEAIPFLIDYVKAALKLWETLDEDDGVYDACCVAMFLLAEFKVKEAFPYLIKYLEFDEDTIDWLIGDVLTGDFGAILASVATFDDIPKIKEIAENIEVYEFSRTAALRALIVLYAEGVYARDDLFAYLGRLLHTFVADDDSYFSIALADACLDVYAREHFDFIEKMLKDGLVDPMFLGIDEFYKLVKNGDEEKCLNELRKERYNVFVADTVKSIEWWACFSEKPDFGRKVGRNEPCPCGSGKKYKKCCLY
jgi:hypothetical protein